MIDRNMKQIILAGLKDLEEITLVENQKGLWAYKKSRSVMARMIEIYEPNGVCWMGGIVKKDNYYTYHHIVEKKNGGLNTIENGAILTENQHEFLNYLERYDINTYRHLNELFRKLNDTRKPPTTQYYEALFAILDEIDQPLVDAYMGLSLSKVRKKY